MQAGNIMTVIKEKTKGGFLCMKIKWSPELFSFRRI